MRCIIFLVLIFVSTLSQGKDILIFGGDNNKEFLGCINCDEMSKNSVWNDMSQYGWNNGFGKWNPFGQYKNPFSSYSACNEFTSNGPVLVDRDGNFYGRLTVNEFVSKSICGVSGSAKLCRALKVMCAGD
jgi:hypothetical protein